MKKSNNSPNAYKASYVQELLVALAVSKHQTGMIIINPVLVAEKWGVVSSSDSVDDIKKATNVLSAVKLFISKAVDDNWNNNNNK